MGMTLVVMTGSVIVHVFRRKPLSNNAVNFDRYGAGRGVGSQMSWKARYT